MAKHAPLVTVVRALGRESGARGWRVQWNEGTGAYHTRVKRSRWFVAEADARTFAERVAVTGGDESFAYRMTRAQLAKDAETQR